MKILNSIITAIYKPLFVVYALYALITFLISATESLHSEFFISIVSFFPKSHYDITYQYRYEIIFGFLVFLTFYMINNVRKLKRRFAQACKSIDDFQREQGDEIAKIILGYSKSETTDIDAKMYNKLSKEIDRSINL